MKFLGQRYSVPEKFSARIESLQTLSEEINHETRKKIVPRGHSQREIHVKIDQKFRTIVNVYLHKSWKHGGQHMIELSFKHRDVTDEDIAIALRKTARCYCVDCTDVESYGRDDDPMIVEVLKVRMAVAQANGIPTDGTDKHEAQIDAVLSQGERNAEADQG